GHAVLGVDHRDDRVEPVVLGDFVVHEERLAHRAGVGHAGRFYDDALEVQFAGLALGAQVAQRAHQVAPHRAADAAVAEFDDFFAGVLHQQVVVDAFGPELVFDDRDAAAMEFAKNAFEQGGLAGTEKAGEDRDGDHFVQTALRIHGKSTAKSLRAHGAPLGGDNGAAVAAGRRITAQSGQGGKPGPTPPAPCPGTRKNAAVIRWMSLYGDELPDIKPWPREP